MDTSPTAFTATLQIYCLCADWCGSCRDYRERFAQAAARQPAGRFAWIDIEDRADLVDPVEVESFPTLLIVRDGQARFFGPVAPHPETLDGLVRTHLAEAPATALADPELAALVQRLGAQAQA